jgi:hypothetical protein
VDIVLAFTLLLILVKILPDFSLLLFVRDNGELDAPLTFTSEFLIAIEIEIKIINY